MDSHGVCYALCTMEFLVIMGIGTVVAIVIVALQPKSGHIPYNAVEGPFTSKAPPKTLAWQKDLPEVVSTDEFDYLRKQARHMEDPRHWPAPFPPEQQNRAGLKVY
jgi:hypothetical protein